VRKRAASENADSILVLFFLFLSLLLLLLLLLLFFSFSYLELGTDGSRVIEGIEDRALEVVRHFDAPRNVARRRVFFVRE